jgi:hypothetical protein
MWLDTMKKIVYSLANKLLQSNKFDIIHNDKYIEKVGYNAQ